MTENSNDLRKRNRRVAGSILAGMFVLAVLTAIFALSTMSYRREIDAVQPDPRPMKRDLLVVSGISAIAVGAGFGFYRWKSRKPN